MMNGEAMLNAVVMIASRTTGSGFAPCGRIDSTRASAGVTNRWWSTIITTPAATTPTSRSRHSVHLARATASTTSTATQIIAITSSVHHTCPRNDMLRRNASTARPVGPEPGIDEDDDTQHDRRHDQQARHQSGDGPEHRPRRMTTHPLWGAHARRRLQGVPITGPV